MQPVLCITEQSGQVLFKLPESLKLEGLVTLCAPDAVCFSRHIPHASGRILAERFYVIGTLQSNCKVGQRFFALFPLIKPYVRFSLIRLSDILLSTALRHASISCKPFSCNRILVAYSPFSFRVCWRFLLFHLQNVHKIYQSIARIHFLSFLVL